MTERNSKELKERYKELKEDMKKICKEKRELKNYFNSVYRSDL